VFQVRSIGHRVKEQQRTRARRLRGVDLKREEGGRGNADRADKYGGQWRDATVERGRCVALSGYGSRARAGFGAGGAL